jgi:hypothetical protein
VVFLIVGAMIYRHVPAASAALVGCDVQNVRMTQNGFTTPDPVGQSATLSADFDNACPVEPPLAYLFLSATDYTGSNDQNPGKLSAGSLTYSGQTCVGQICSMTITGFETLPVGTYYGCGHTGTNAWNPTAQNSCTPFTVSPTCYQTVYDSCDRVVQGDGGGLPYCQDDGPYYGYSRTCTLTNGSCPAGPPCSPHHIVTDCIPVAQSLCGTPPPTVTISVNPATITLGQPATLSWTTTDVTVCTSSGAWAGSEPTSSAGFSVTPTSTGSYSYILTCTGPDGSADDAATLQVNPAASSGTIDVTSENSVVTSTLVFSEWTFVGSVTDPCSGDQNNCAGKTKTYLNQVAGDPNDIYILNTQAPNPTGYALRTIERHVAAAPKQNPIITFFKDLINQAHAVVVCGFLNSGASSCPNPDNSFTLANQGDVAHFIILWDPVASLGVSPTTVNLTDANPGTVTVTNGGVQGSTLTWNTSVAYGAGCPPNCSWLSVTPANDNAGVAAGSSDTVTLQNTGALPAGSYSATVKFSGASLPCAANPCKATGSPITVTVNLTVSSGAISVKVTPPVATVATGTTQKFTAKVKNDPGNKGVTWDVNGTVGGNAIVGTVSPAGLYTAPAVIPSPPTVKVRATSKADPSKSDFATVTIVAGPYCAYFIADPQRIVVPEPSNLSWDCTNVTACNIDQGVGPVPIKGTTPVTPGVNTTYVLTCDQGSLSTRVTVDVIVGTPGRIETSTPTGTP